VSWISAGAKVRVHPQGREKGRPTDGHGAYTDSVWRRVQLTQLFPAFRHPGDASRVAPLFPFETLSGRWTLAVCSHFSHTRSSKVVVHQITCKKSKVDELFCEEDILFPTHLQNVLRYLTVFYLELGLLLFYSVHVVFPFSSQTEARE
jgi:hypothetical protein